MVFHERWTNALLEGYVWRENMHANTTAILDAMFGSLLCGAMYQRAWICSFNLYETYVRYH